MSGWPVSKVNVLAAAASETQQDDVLWGTAFLAALHSCAVYMGSPSLAAVTHPRPFLHLDTLV